ncbi:unnamed protein product [Prunus armeniaca]
MFTRFTDIVNSLKALGKDYANVEHGRKILWSLLKKWEPKVTAIMEARDLSKLSLDELLHGRGKTKINPKEVLHLNPLI